MSTAPGQIMGKPSVKALRKRLSGRIADKPRTENVIAAITSGLIRCNHNQRQVIVQLKPAERLDFGD
jgi:hypothetical protein